LLSSSNLITKLTYISLHGDFTLSAMMFYGKYTNIRRLLDYSFHKLYSKERQLLQDDIVDHFTSNCSPRDIGRCNLILTCGAMGSGKTHTVKIILGEKFRQYVRADVDAIKHHVPEMKELLKTNPNNAGKILHSEACTIHEILFRSAIEEKKNVIIDGSLRNSGFFRDYLERVDPEYYITILHVVAPLEVCIERAEARAKHTGRLVPIESIKESFKKCPGAVRDLAEIADWVVEIENGEEKSDSFPQVELKTLVQLEKLRNVYTR
jgi:predicted ABC-type ATPase